MEPYLLKPMEAPYTDWTGSAAAENSMIDSSGDLYELAGLEHGDWTIIGVEFGTFSHGKPSNWEVHVFAVDRRKHGVESFEDMQELDVREGALPVTDILLHDVTLEDVVRCMKFVGFRLESPNFRQMRVVALADHPVQEVPRELG